MKKRLLSLVLCLVMVFSLLPFAGMAARPEGNSDGYQSLGTRSWTALQVYNWAPSAGQNAYGSAHSYLYYYDGTDYRLLTADPDIYYYSGTGSKNIQNTFSTRSYSDGTDNGKYENSTNYFCLDGNTPHRLYYNVYQNGSNVTGSTQFVELYYYVNSYESAGLVTNESTMAAGISSNEIRLIDKNGAVNKTVRWPFAYGTGLWGDYAGKETAVTGLYTRSTNNSKRAVTYQVNGEDVYLMRNLTSSGQPSKTVELFYMVDPGTWKDPETVPVDDPDPTPGTETLTNGSIIHNPGRVNDKGLKLSKNLSSTNGETFDLTMESYSTANTNKTAVTEKVPTDFVVIVDQSGSMKENDMMTGQPTQVSGSRTLEEIAEGSYYVKGDDGQFYRVYATKNYLYEYFAPNTKWTDNIIKESGGGLRWFQGDRAQDFSIANQYYFRDESGAKAVYRPITVTASGEALTYYVKLYWKTADGTKEYFHRGDTPVYKNVLDSGLFWGPTIEDGETGYSAINWFCQTGWQDPDAYLYTKVDSDAFKVAVAIFTFGQITQLNTGMYINYPMYRRHIGYTDLRYRDVNGVEHIVKPMQGNNTAEYCNSDGEAITTKDGSTRYNYNKLYEASGTTTRLSALQTALTQFVTAVANEKDTKTGEIGGVDNRIAIVGFSSDTDRTNTYNNTELLTGSTFSIERGNSIPSGYGTSGDTGNTKYNYNGKQMRYATADDYAGALIKVNVDGEVGTINSKLTDAIAAVTAYGGTQPEYGFKMAKSIFDNRGTGLDKTTYRMQTVEGNPTVNRNTIVIFFTDGHPGDHDYSDQYKEANDVIKDALPLKQAGVQVFSIGVFGESDGNPLLYPRDTYADGTPKSVAEDSDIEFEDGFMSKVKDSGSYYYYMKRQWRSNADNAYGAAPNDTIFDYMSVVSSNYPAAGGFCSDEWLAWEAPEGTTWLSDITAKRGASVNGNQYYRMASNQATLVSAFTQAVTHVGTISTVSTSVVLDTNSVFKDTINTADFDVANATYTVYQQAIHVNENVTSGSMIEPGALTELQAARPVPSDGVITYSGFDYRSNYVAYGHPDGYKLVVKVNGLEPKTFGTFIKSNADTETLKACGIYEYGKDTPAIFIESPEVKVFKAASTYIADFNAPLIVATDVEEGGITGETSRNGAFARTNDGKATYQLSSGTQQAAAGTTVAINSAYTQADRANITGKHAEDGERAIVQPRDVIVIPASSVYYDDNLTTPIAPGDGSGWNENVSETHATANLAAGQHTFTFYGTGIDVYCTTDTNGGMIQFVVDDSAVSAIRNYTKETTRYNVPTVSVRDLGQGEHTLVINVLGSSNYRLDGIRIYNPVSNQEIYTDQAEKYAAYVPLRDALINDATSGGVSFTPGESTVDAIVGALFVDDSSKLSQTKNKLDGEGNVIINEETGEPEQELIYATEFAAYKANSPKHEIYLDANQSVTFQLTGTALSGKLWIGLSAPDAGTNFTRSKVSVNGNTGKMITVTSAVDMYYPITSEMIGEGASSITITNEGSTMISVTNLKITGVPSFYEAATSEPERTTGYAVASISDVMPLVFEPVTMKTVRMAANGGVDPEEPEVIEPEDPSEPEPTPTPTPTPTPEPSPEVPDDPEPTAVPSFLETLQQLVSSFVSNLFGSISRLFGN